jgi:putative transposase
MAYREYYKRHLPHWQPINATVFVTCRLANSLPASVIIALDQERQAEQRNLVKMIDIAQRQKQGRLNAWSAYSHWDTALEQYKGGPFWLGQPEIAKIIAEALHFRDGKVFDLLAYCIMPNHIHFVSQICIPIDNEEPLSLQSILQSLKRHTARQANLLLGRQGAFWQEENYDHVARDSEEITYIIQYIINNPIKAGYVK